jgi:hypothetical protein
MISVIIPHAVLRENDDYLESHAVSPEARLWERLVPVFPVPD